MIINEAQLRRLLNEYVSYFNHSRPHQGIDQRVTEPKENLGLPAVATGRVIAFPVLGGLHHEYRHAA